MSAPIRFLRASARALAHAFEGDVPDLPVTSIMAGNVPARLYSPPGSEQHPPLLFFHGGGFISCDLDTHDALCRRLATASGLRVLAIAYRLAPEYPCPAQVDDALDACRWALSAPSALGGNTRSIIVAGDSAGGYLAVRCAIALNERKQQVIGQLLFYPLISMDPELWTKPLHAARLVGRMAVTLMHQNLGGMSYPSLHSFDVESLPRTIVVSGKALDPVHADSIDFVAALRDSGVRVDHIVLPRLFHGALNMDRLSRAARQVIAKAGEAMKQFTLCPTTASPFDPSFDAGLETASSPNSHQ